MKTGMRITKDRMKDVTKALVELASTQILVGIPGDKAARRGDPMTNATIGYIMENGAPEANIPARPHLAPGVRKSSKQTSGLLKVAGVKALIGDVSGMRRAMNAAGSAAVNSVKREITEGSFAPLAPSTIAARKRRGRKGVMKPLIDTGQYRQAVTYVVRKK